MQPALNRITGPLVTVPTFAPVRLFRCGFRESNQRTGAVRLKLSGPVLRAFRRGNLPNAPRGVFSTDDKETGTVRSHQAVIEGGGYP